MDNINQTPNQAPNVPQQPVNNKNMKPCKSCGTLIAKNAKTCPQCGAKNKNRKALIIILIVLGVIILIGAIAGSGGDSSEKTDTAQTKANKAVETEKAVDNEIGQYSVEIEKVRLTSTYDGKPAIVVTYKFTNNTNDKPTAFWVAFDDAVYQDGVGLNEAYLLKNGDPYSADNARKEIKKGASIEVEQAYELNDSTTPLDVEVKELFSLSDKTISRTFNLK